VGGDSRRLAMFEGVYSVPRGISYNSYLLKDNKTVLFDTVDRAVSELFFENVKHVLDGRALDYLVIHHMEPDHSASIAGIVSLYPGVKIICNAKTAAMIKQFFSLEKCPAMEIIKEGSVIETGLHKLRFMMAPMVHWPEVMITYDEYGKTLFSADAFGVFGALNGAIFADEVDFDRDFLDESRRYYANIVGKYGAQVQTMLKKICGLEVDFLCPLHGFVWREDIGYYVDKYIRWSKYMPEENGVMIAYASIYGNTENAANIIACRLRDAGIRTDMFDVSVTPDSEIIASAFKWSHLLFASTTYNAGIFVSMDNLLRELAAHNIQNRTVAFVQNGSWLPASGKLMRGVLAGCRNITFLDETVNIKSSLKAEQLEDIDNLVRALAASMPESGKAEEKAGSDTASLPTAYPCLLPETEKKTMAA